jgi:hypothetical protein
MPRTVNSHLQINAQETSQGSQPKLSHPLKAHVKPDSWRADRQAKHDEILAQDESRMNLINSSRSREVRRTGRGQVEGQVEGEVRLDISCPA